MKLTLWENEKNDHHYTLSDQMRPTIARHADGFNSHGL